MLTLIIVLSSVAAYVAIGAVIARLVLTALVDDDREYARIGALESAVFTLTWSLLTIGAATWYLLLRPLREFVLAPLRKRFEDD